MNITLPLSELPMDHTGPAEPGIPGIVENNTAHPLLWREQERPKPNPHEESSVF